MFDRISAKCSRTAGRSWGLLAPGLPTATIKAAHYCTVLPTTPDFKNIIMELEQHAPRPFWGPVTSSVDWCEKNYAWSRFIAEWWNTWSNVPGLALGVAAMVLATKKVASRKTYDHHLLFCKLTSNKVAHTALYAVGGLL